MKKLIALLLALVMVLGLVACGKQEAEAQPTAPAEKAPAQEGAAPAAPEDPMLYFTQFEEPFELHIVYGIGADAVSTLEGDDTAEDNFYTRYLLDKYNIKIVFDWTASTADFDQKLAMSISSDTLPDAWICSPQYWKAAAKNGQLRDITADYENWVCDEIKQLYDVAGKRVMDACSYDGALTCLTGMTVTTEGVSCLIINKNWLDQLNLEVPKTLEDVQKVAQAFKDAGLAGAATVPILGPANDNRLYSTFNDSFNCVMGLDAVFAANDAYPGYFYTDENGEMVYGSLTNETRETLVLLNEWYEAGLLDQEIGIRTTGWDPINANTCGMFFGQWWDIGFGNPSSFTNDENADWRAYPIYTGSGDWNTKLPDITCGARFCISADASDDAARAAIIAVNALYGERSNDLVNTTEDIAWYPLRLTIAPEDIVDRGREHCLAVLEGTEDVDLYKGDLVYNEIWQSSQFVKEVIPNYESGMEIGRDDFVISDENQAWQAIYSWIIGDMPYNTIPRDKEVLPAISYMTESMEMYWDNLESAEKAMMLSVITGEKDITAFDEFVTQWYAEGGETILAEVAAEVA